MDTIKRITSKLVNLGVTKVEDINVLLLGETGVGKSTFINALSNYFAYDDFDTAVQEELSILIPTLVTVTDENGRAYEIVHGSDKNEKQEIGSAGTQYVKTYIFPIGDTGLKLRLIDSPGMGDPRGIDQDDINCENILHYLGGLEKLHAICLLMKPNNTRNTAFFSYCFKQILTRLDKSTSENIIFIFTNTRGSNYTPGDTLPCLKVIIDDVKSKPPHANIPLRGNIFSVDNEPFKILVAMKNDIRFDRQVEECCNQSWKVSSEESWKLIKYILGDDHSSPLQALSMKNTVSINEARRLIEQLSHPLSDISQLIEDNIQLLERHQQLLDVENLSLEELKRQLYIPSATLNVIELKQPVTVCTDQKCADIVKIGELTKWHYRQRCHDPCYLKGVPKEVIGDHRLLSCAAMAGTKTCTKCSCSYALHMHVYYMTEPVEANIVNTNVRENINCKAKALKAKEQIMKDLKQRKEELEQEHKCIVEIIAKFAHFLQCNAITPFNDAYKEYVEHLITRERGLGNAADIKKIDKLKQLLRRHEEIKAALDNTGNIKSDDLVVITSHNIKKQIDKLYKLKHNGQKIKELFDAQAASRKQEYEKSVEYVVRKQINLNRLNKEKMFEEMKQKTTANIKVKEKEPVEKSRNDQFENSHKNVREEHDSISLHHSRESIHSQPRTPKPNHCQCENCRSYYHFHGAWTPPHYMPPPAGLFHGPSYESYMRPPRPYYPPYEPYMMAPPDFRYSPFSTQREPHQFQDPYRSYDFSRSPHYTPNEPSPNSFYQDWRQNSSPWTPPPPQHSTRFPEDHFERFSHRGSNQEAFYSDKSYSPQFQNRSVDGYDEHRLSRNQSFRSPERPKNDSDYMHQRGTYYRE